MAPALSEEIAKAIEHLWQTLGSDSGSVILDVDPEVYRLGYGTPGGLKLLEKASQQYGASICRHQEGVRIGLVISDDNTLIFTPTPLLIEAGSSIPEHPNAIELSALPNDIARDVGLGPEGACEQTVGLDHVDQETMSKTQSDLDKNPPVKFDIARTVRVFNSQLEFVNLEIKGCLLSKSTAKIPSALMGLAASDEMIAKLTASYKLVEKKDLIEENGKSFEDRIRQKRKVLDKNYLRNITGFGKVIRRDLKEDFLREVAELKKEIEVYRNRIRDKISGYIENNAHDLTQTFFDPVKSNIPKEWRGSLGRNPNDKDLKRFLKDQFANSFGKPEKYTEEMSVNLLFKGVTYETLSDENFIKIAQAHFPQLHLMEEFDAAREVPEREEFFK
ncbi:hypothetical protein G0Q06_11845 [Puniceicoccales bacterium CK1056]|uniref:Uncharacterized protein n=1 Tax=Oceanipulchritudo coccoides TaxID=2706888 RepID=A0A6B2M4Y6_9BACT|nr:hypothetical protein [Oceanipulchritudo coccoides]NDV63147.1 hypothetical protein [Oceanipulchritudo coccoides]